MSKYEIRVRQFPLDAAMQFSMLSYDQYRRQRTEHITPGFRRRIAVNWLRHQGSNYDALVAAHPNDAAEIKHEVLGEIAAQYPDLAAECCRQQRTIGGSPRAHHQA